MYTDKRLLGWISNVIFEYIKRAGTQSAHARFTRYGGPTVANAVSVGGVANKHSVKHIDGSNKNSPMAFVYVLRSLKDKKLYIGSTRQAISSRLLRHNNGQIASTKNRRPFVVLYSEPFSDYSSARRRELYLKSGSGREHLNRILLKWAGTQVAKGGRLSKSSVLLKGGMEK